MRQLTLKSKLNMKFDYVVSCRLYDIILSHMGSTRYIGSDVAAYLWGSRVEKHRVRVLNDRLYTTPYPRHYARAIWSSAMYKMFFCIWAIACFPTLPTCSLSVPDGISLSLLMLMWPESAGGLRGKCVLFYPFSMHSLRNKRPIIVWSSDPMDVFHTI